MTGDTLPYPEPGRETYTGGHNPSRTSTDRALDEASSGRARAVRDEVERIVGQAGRRGVTVSEVVDDERVAVHHGSASGALSNLHKTGRIVRLDETRARCHVYVLDQWVEDRPLAPFIGYDRRDPAARRTLDYLLDQRDAGAALVSVDVVLDLLGSTR